MKNYYLYMHTSPSGKKYVGVSCDPQKRWGRGIGYRKNDAFYADILRFGWDSFSHAVIAVFDNESDALEAEGALIASENLTNPAHGYNLLDGERAPSEATRIRMSQASKGNKRSVGGALSQETKSKIASSLEKYYSSHAGSFTGRKHSEHTKSLLRKRHFSDTTRAKMSANHADVSGEKNPSARPVTQFSKDGSAIAEYPYAKAAADMLNLDLSSIIKCCRGKKKTCGGFKWAYKHQDSNQMLLPTTPGS